MKVTQVTVDFRKTVSDGNYGNETAQAQYVVLVDDGEDADEVVAQVITRARNRAVAELKGSESLSVRRALNPPKRMCPECGEQLGDDDMNGYYHPSCETAARERRAREREEERARWEAERNGQRPELVPAGGTTAEDDEFARDAADDDEEDADF